MQKTKMSPKFWLALTIFSLVGQVLIPGIVGPAIGAYVLCNAEQVLNNDGTYSFIPNCNIFAAALMVAVVVWVALFVVFHILKNKEKN